MRTVTEKTGTVTNLERKEVVTMYGDNYSDNYKNGNYENGQENSSTAGGMNTAGSTNTSGSTQTGGSGTYYNNNGYYSGYNQNSAYSGSTYGTAYASGSGSNGKPKKEKKPKTGGGFGKKALVTVSLGLFFGVCAGLGFYAVDSATGLLDGMSGRQETEITQDAKNVIQNEETAEAMAAIAEGTVDGTDMASTVVTDVSSVVAEVMPAIVSINNTYTEKMSYFGQTLENEATSAGSGIIVGESDTELLIVTNYHVVEGTDKLVIQFADGSEAEAQMKGSDSEMDLAVIAVALDDVDADTRNAIAVATMGDSDSLTVGEPAIAIGNALGYGQSVTVGVVSALDRVIDLSAQEMNGTSVDAADTEDVPTFIQTDAAINPGNSGGALLNMKGEVIGINSSKIGGTVIEGIGYAIPISAAKPIIEDLMLRETRTKVSEENKGYLGISQLSVVDEMAEVYGMPKGVYVSQVYEGTGAEAAGIQKGNIITEFDGNKITGSEDLIRVLEYYSEGDTVEVTIMQGSPSGWESKTVTVTLGGKFE